MSDIDRQALESKVIKIANEIYSEPPGYDPVSANQRLGVSALFSKKDEFLQEIEDEFDLSIPDEEASKLETVGNVIEYVVAVVPVQMSEAKDIESKTAKLSDKQKTSRENTEPESSQCNIFQKFARLFSTKNNTKTKFKQVPVSPQVQSMISLTRASVGGKVRRLEVEFEDGTILENVQVIDESIMELPIEHVNKEIKKTRIPYDQN